MAILGVTYSATRLHDGALKRKAETLMLRREKLGDTHPEPLMSMHNIGVVHYQTNRPKNALGLWREAFGLALKAGHAELPMTKRIV